MKDKITIVMYQGIKNKSMIINSLIAMKIKIEYNDGNDEKEQSNDDTEYE